MGVMDYRRKIIQNEPHLAEASSSSLLTFRTDMVAPLKKCEADFSPTQEGSGDPSPNNVRGFVRRTSLDLYVSPSQVGTDGIVYSSDFSSTIGGRVDFINGVVTTVYVDRVVGLGVANSAAYTTSNSGWRLMRVRVGNIFGGTIDGSKTILSSHFKQLPAMTSAQIRACTTPWCCAFASTNTNYLWFIGDSTITDDTAWKNFCSANKIEISAVTAVSTVKSIDNVNIKTIRGTNNIWSNANENVRVKYWTH